MQEEVDASVVEAPPAPWPSYTTVVWSVRKYLDDLSQATAEINREDMVDLVQIVVHALTTGRRILLAGNGGSTSSTIHMASDWSELGRHLEAPALVLALSENIARLTAVANDRGYLNVFAEQILERGRQGDLLLLLSVSGDSENLVAAARAGRERGMTVAALLGRPGKLAELTDCYVVAGQADYGLSEDLQVTFTHIVVRAVNGGTSQVHGSSTPRRIDHDPV